MRFAELDVFLLAEDVPEHGLLAGMPGTVLDVYPQFDDYEVEFANSDGVAVYIGTLAAHLLRSYQEDLAAHQDVLDRLPAWGD